VWWIEEDLDPADFAEALSGQLAVSCERRDEGHDRDHAMSGE